MNTTVAFITNCDTKTINRQDGRSFPLYQVHDNFGNVWVAKKDVWELAQRFIGQQATLLTRDEQKGNFLNHYLDAVFPVNGAPGPAQTYAHPLDNPNGVTQAEAAAMNAGWDPNRQPMPTYAPQPMPTTYAQPQAPQGPSEHDLSIYRQVAAKVAAHLAQGDDLKFWTAIPELMVWFKLGQRPHRITSQEEPQKSQGEQFAANVLSDSGVPVPAPDDDIPF